MAVPAEVQGTPWGEVGEGNGMHSDLDERARVAWLGGWVSGGGWHKTEADHKASGHHVWSLDFIRKAVDGCFRGLS